MNEVDFLRVWIIGFSIVVILATSGKGYLPLSCYSEHGYYESAPDGFYNILLNEADYKSNIVDFVRCPSSGSELHGSFKFQEGLVFPEGFYGWLTVALYENRVVWWTYTFETKHMNASFSWEMSP